MAISRMKSPQREPTSHDDTAIDKAGDTLVQNLLKLTVIGRREFEKLPRDVRRDIENERSAELQIRRLIKLDLLTEYQAERIQMGNARELIVGNYCIVDYLGRGAMGTVYKCRHIYLGRTAALKILSDSLDESDSMIERFHSEALVLSKIRHPNIVLILDAGCQPTNDVHYPEMHYIVMEYVPGIDLQQLVEERGPVQIANACDFAYQIAAALHEVHPQLLVHRDVKPSNIRVTPNNEAKLLDFGICKFLGRRLTHPGTFMGSFEYMAPEQMTDASSVDIRADIFGLGATLYWCLTGERPYGETRNLLAAIDRRANVPCVRRIRSDVPVELDAVVRRMLAPNPNDRHPDPQAVMRALHPFAGDAAWLNRIESNDRESFFDRAAGKSSAQSKTYRVLIVDDEPHNRDVCRRMLDVENCRCDEATDGQEALSMVAKEEYHLVLLDVDMPGITGVQVLQRLRENPTSENQKIIMLSGLATTDELAEMMSKGADDFISKPFTRTQLTNRVQAALRFKDAQDRANQISRNLLRVNHTLEEHLLERDSDLIHARNALVLGLAELVAQRDNETGAHLLRLQRYSRLLAEEATQYPAFASQIDGNFIDMIECCAPLHDIGKVAVPDEILLKPGKLTPEERLVMESHASIGGDVLEKVASRHGFAVAFFQMAVDIARHHHERWDGAGYPHKLAGNAIPLAARIVAVGDVYDALRSRRPYKTPLPHDVTVDFILNTSVGQFDPNLLRVFEPCVDRFATVYDQIIDK